MTDGSIRFLAGLSLAALAAITGIVSYLHALTVVYLTGSAGLVAYLIPFVADLMIVTASLAILDAIRHQAPKPPLAMVSLVAGIGSTLAMNIVAGLHISAGGALVAALPPVAFVLSLETLMGIVRLARAGDGASHLTATDGQCPHQVAMSAEDAVVTAYLHARDCLGEPVSQRQLSATFGVPRPKVATLIGTLNGTRPNDAEEDVTERVSLTHQQPDGRSSSQLCRGRLQPTSNARRCCARWWLPACTHGLLPHSCTTAARRPRCRRFGPSAPAAGAGGWQTANRPVIPPARAGRSGGVRSRLLRPVRPQSGRWALSQRSRHVT